MPSTITLGHIEAHEKLTARVLFKPHGETSYVDLGNVKEYSEAHERSPVTRVVAEAGYRRTNDEQTDVVTYAWEFTLDEFDANLLKIKDLSAQGTTAQQAAATAPAGTATITSIVCERWYPIGKVGLNTVVAKIATVTLTEGTDYDVDLDAGLIRFHDTDNVDAGDNVDLTFGNVAVDFETFTGLETPTFRGDVMILETNQFSKIPLKTTTFTGVLRATEFPTQSGEFGTWKVRATATTKPAIKRRSAA
ncbi:MAG TPA: hypothetical protein PKJ98_20325 [Verrucomicrobiota bacterium]|nr:hypothetical protein [Verrucomicrobiota bacterium]